MPGSNTMTRKPLGSSRRRHPTGALSSAVDIEFLRCSCIVKVVRKGRKKACGGELVYVSGSILPVFGLSQLSSGPYAVNVLFIVVYTGQLHARSQLSQASVGLRHEHLKDTCSIHIGCFMWTAPKNIGVSVIYPDVSLRISLAEMAPHLLHLDGRPGLISAVCRKVLTHPTRLAASPHVGLAKRRLPQPTVKGI